MMTFMTTCVLWMVSQQVYFQINGFPASGTGEIYGWEVGLMPSLEREGC
jgi:hypothetical protein